MHHIPLVPYSCDPNKNNQRCPVILNVSRRSNLQSCGEKYPNRVMATRIPRMEGCWAEYSELGHDLKEKDSEKAQREKSSMIISPAGCGFGWEGLGLKEVVVPEESMELVSRWNKR